MKKLNFNQMQNVTAGTKTNCLGRGMVAPFMIIFSVVISDSYLNSWWSKTVDDCL